MKRIVTIIAAFGALVAASAAIADAVGIEITNAGFKPKDVTVESGSSVTWKNADAVAHDVVVDKTACKLSLQPKQSSSCTFTTPGSFAYDDPTTTNAAFGGKITVVPAAQRSVTLVSSRPLTIFGGAAILSGTTSGKKAGESVTVFERPAGEPAHRIDIQTTDGGNWTLRVQPRVRTEYQAQYQNAQSGKVTISVRPRITLQKVGLSRFLIVVLANRSLAGKMVDLTRWQPGTGWTPIQQVQLNSIARTDTIAVRTVTSFVRAGTKLRVFMPESQVSPDYLEGHSNFVVK
jgi:plastocyanin